MKVVHEIQDFKGIEDHLFRITGSNFEYIASFER